MQTETHPHLPVNHVFVDLENVKTIDTTVLGGKNLTLHLFLGPQNKKLEVDVVEKLITHAMNYTGKDKPDAEAKAVKVVGELQKTKLITVDDKGAVSYNVE